MRLKFSANVVQSRRWHLLGLPDVNVADEGGVGARLVLVADFAGVEALVQPFVGRFLGGGADWRRTLARSS